MIVCVKLGISAYRHVSAVSLEGLRFTEGISYDFPNATLAPHTYLVVAKSPNQLAKVVDLRRVIVTGPYQGKLSNNSKRIKLEDRRGNTILDFTYQDTWYTPKNNGGYSLEMIDPVNTPPDDYEKKSRWQISRMPSGSPGQAN